MGVSVKCFILRSIMCVCVCMCVFSSERKGEEEWLKLKCKESQSIINEKTRLKLLKLFNIKRV